MQKPKFSIGQGFQRLARPGQRGNRHSYFSQRIRVTRNSMMLP